MFRAGLRNSDGRDDGAQAVGGHGIVGRREFAFAGQRSGRAGQRVVRRGAPLQGAKIDRAEIGVAEDERQRVLDAAGLRPAADKGCKPEPGERRRNSRDRHHSGPCPPAAPDRHGAQHRATPPAVTPNRTGPRSMSPSVAPIAMLVLSNVSMTFAWYGHLRFKLAPLWIAVLVSWGIAFFEYWLAVPANRIGSRSIRRRN